MKVTFIITTNLECDIPEMDEDEKYVLRMTTDKDGQWDACNPQCSVFVNGDTCLTRTTQSLSSHRITRTYTYIFTVEKKL